MFKKIFSTAVGLALIISGANWALSQNKPSSQNGFQEMVGEVKSAIKSVPAEVVKVAMESKEKAVILDVREPHEFADGHLPGARNIPLGILESTVKQQISDKKTKIYVYCRTASRATLGTKTLINLGYTNAVLGAFHYDEWVKAGYPVER